MTDLTKTFAEFDIAFIELQVTLALLNANLAAAKICGDYEVARHKAIHNKHLADYYKNIIQYND